MVYDYTNEINVQNVSGTGLKWSNFERFGRGCCSNKRNFPRRDFCNCRKPQCWQPQCKKPQCDCQKFCWSCCPWGLLVITTICRCCK